MKNKLRLKQYIISTLIVFICLFVMFLILNIYEYKTYTKNFNNKISAIITLVKDKYPEITDKEIIEIINSNKQSDDSFFLKYGIDIDNKAVLLENDKSYHTFLIINMSFLIITMASLCILYFRYNYKRKNDIKDIIKCIEQINRRNYELEIDTISEDELSILKNEIYKTAVMLKEAALNSNKDKLNLKKSLEDISHQLKTPLTAINILLDNLLDNPDMDEKTRMEFLKDISRNIANINFLVQTLLKLSRFDVNEVSYNYKNIKLKDIIDKSCKNIESLCDLKNVKIKCDLSRDIDIYCDFYWQVEAISNILKNCVEYSNESSDVIIKCSENDVYILIEIIDFGKGMSEEEQKHIFERFYKGKNSNNESFGIGLALAKTIIEKNNGKINVESKLGEGTKFSIRYYKF